ncbi:DUF1289 domain-containing protein [Motilimonas sp. KMU-193]|uniref:DUF1289 domain-containing protein n=1 Tax=Motilimonas sp. KMU-193 TaxID=3388668 RepID=UPI00396B32E3
MEQLEFFAIPSPCRGICRTDNRGFCVGCMRSREERFNWLELTPSQQRNIIRLCRQRMIRKLRAERAQIQQQEQPQTPPLTEQEELF